MVCNFLWLNIFHFRTWKYLRGYNSETKGGGSFHERNFHDGLAVWICWMAATLFRGSLRKWNVDQGKETPYKNEYFVINIVHNGLSTYISQPVTFLKRRSLSPSISDHSKGELRTWSYGSIYYALVGTGVKGRMGCEDREDNSHGYFILKHWFIGLQGLWLMKVPALVNIARCLQLLLSSVLLIGLLCSLTVGVCFHNQPSLNHTHLRNTHAFFV